MPNELPALIPPSKDGATLLRQITAHADFRTVTPPLAIADMLEMADLIDDFVDNASDYSSFLIASHHDSYLGLDKQPSFLSRTAAEQPEFSDPLPPFSGSIDDEINDFFLRNGDKILCPWAPLGVTYLRPGTSRASSVAPSEASLSLRPPTARAPVARPRSPTPSPEPTWSSFGRPIKRQRRFDPS